MILSRIPSFLHRRKLAKARRAGSELARHGADIRREVRRLKRERLHEALRRDVQAMRELTTGEGFLP